MKERDHTSGRRMVLLALTLMIYVSALFLPAVEHPLSDTKVQGYVALAEGYRWPFTIAWLANLALLPGVLGFGARLYSLSIGAGAIGLCLAWLSPMVTQKPLRAFGPGFHVWWLTFAVLIAVSLAEAAAARSDAGDSSGEQRED